MKNYFLKGVVFSKISRIFSNWKIIFYLGIFFYPPQTTYHFQVFFPNHRDMIQCQWYRIPRVFWCIWTRLWHYFTTMACSWPHIGSPKKKSSLPKWCILALLSYYKGNEPKMSKNPDFLRIFQSVFKYRKMILMMFWDVSSVCRVSLRSWNIFWYVVIC